MYPSTLTNCAKKVKHFNTKQKPLEGVVFVFFIFLTTNPRVQMFDAIRGAVEAFSEPY